jgi:hypothetical protein
VITAAIGVQAVALVLSIPNLFVRTIVSSKPPLCSSRGAAMPQSATIKKFLVGHTMQINKYKKILLIITITFSTLLLAGTNDNISNKFNQFMNVNNESFELEANNKISSSSRAAMMENAYVHLFSKEQTNDNLRKINNDDLVTLLRAASYVTTYTLNGTYAQDSARDLLELEARHKSVDADYLSVYENYVGARMFEEARKVYALHPVTGMEQIPSLQSLSTLDQPGPKAWFVDNNKDSISLMPIDLRGVHIVVVGHPLCHFTRNAIAFLSQDAQLRSIFDRYAIWLAPPSKKLSIHLFQAWNKDHPAQAMVLANRYDDWPMIDYWDTPTFYFLRDGKKVAEVQGWPTGGRKSEILSAAHNLGIK